MKSRRLGSLTVSVVGLGTNNFGTDFFGAKCDQAQAANIVAAAIDVGVTLIDTAEEYSTVTSIGTGQSEQFIGTALRGSRSRVVIATKFSSRAAHDSAEAGALRITRAVEGSMKRLGTDWIDLYQQHFPDPALPSDEVLTALDRLVRDGKVREIGCCNFSGAMMDAALASATRLGLRAFATAQNQFNVLDDPLEDGVLDACHRQALMLLPFFPLASGLLTGKYRSGERAPVGSRFATDAKVANMLRRQIAPERIRIAERLEAYAVERGHTLLELAISWLVSHPFVGSVIAGASSPEQIQANAAASSWELSADELSTVASIVGRASA